MRRSVCKDRNSCVARAPLTLLYSIILKSETRVSAHKLGAVHCSNNVIGRLKSTGTKRREVSVVTTVGRKRGLSSPRLRSAGQEHSFFCQHLVEKVQVTITAIGNHCYGNNVHREGVVSDLMHKARKMCLFEAPRPPRARTF